MQPQSIHRVLTTALALAAGLCSLAAVTASPARAGESLPSKSFLFRSAPSVTYGATVTLHGQVTDGAGTLVAEGRVHLLRTVGQGEPTVFSVRDLAKDRTPAWTFVPSVTATYQLRYVGEYGGRYAGSSSDRLGVMVRRDLNDRWRSTDRTYHGKVMPNYRGRPVYIQRTYCATPASSACRWSAYRTVTTNRYGNWAVRLPNPTSRTTFRGYVPPSNGYGGALSNRTVTLH